MSKRWCQRAESTAPGRCVPLLPPTHNEGGGARIVAAAPPKTALATRPLRGRRAPAESTTPPLSSVLVPAFVFRSAKT